ncbi:eukaryotic-type phosphoribosylaminoimidazole carboxylase [Dunaliella salina]|uniref:phosphoribosylaminoimidazole carboxylase n=1 Tax=Dunaliella salina TaxID=3046 RepID=A0ABQ7H174_DUNSA|nr:eukaryotic-type phosphoribosylaminoimidazole carboxylase [Dunaliella salina]|eukprot:KAF5840607.1 eukaryotic-type phosphoribosylaminoimidazole carboxylase [Dunaliella salina]
MLHNTPRTGSSVGARASSHSQERLSLHQARRQVPISRLTVPASLFQAPSSVPSTTPSALSPSQNSISQASKTGPLLASAQRAPLSGRTSRVAMATVADEKADITAVSDTGLPRSAVVGVLGGGQLGRMMALRAANLGVRMKCLDPAPDAPASWIASQRQGHFRDAQAIKDFASQEGVSVLTTEIEHIDADAVEEASKALGIEMEPTPHTIRLIQDKFAQKQYFQANGVPLPEFREIKCRGCMEATGEQFGFPFMLKIKRLAYDGRGNAVVKTAADIDSAVESLGGSSNGSVMSYPVVETIHKDSICWVTEAPADAPTKHLEAAKAISEKAIGCLEGAGIFGVEMFLCRDGSILLNEVAPRPHNSGHYTMDGCVTCQFENHTRAILGWPLGDTSLNCNTSIMLNVLGEDDDDEGVRIAHEKMAKAYKTPGAKVHWYGKDGMKKGRKVGHINVSGSSKEEARARLAMLDPGATEALKSSAAAMQEAFAESVTAQPQVGIIMGSDSDLPTMKAALEVLREFGVEGEINIVSAHRTPELMMEYARTAHKRGIKAIIAGADMILLFALDLQVATVAIGNAANAGLLAVRMLAGHDPAILKKMLAYQDSMRDVVLAKGEALKENGV